MFTRYLRCIVLVSLVCATACAQLIEPNIEDFDADGDGFIDMIDEFPDNSAEWSDLDNDGTGDNADTDDDGDGCLDTEDAFPDNVMECLDTDNDGVGNDEDADDDGDGELDVDDNDPLNPDLFTDTDGDGETDSVDADDDGDGVADADDRFPLDEDESLDTDDDGEGNTADTDDDGDGENDAIDPDPLDETVFTDADLDGISDYLDSDADGVPNDDDDCPLDEDGSVDTDGDGTCNENDGDDDGDGCADSIDDSPLLNTICNDTDGDGVANNADAFPNDATESADTDGDGVGNNDDCLDNDATANQNRLEVCANTKDDDCDGSTDELECLIAIAGGTFNMGADADADGEGTLTSQVHDVQITAFYIDKYEVNNNDYEACVSAGSCSTPSAFNSIYGRSDYDNYPIFYVSWYQAYAYCQYVGKRLPTESQWEYAARNGATANTYPWGNGAPSTTLANYFDGVTLGSPTVVTDYSAGKSTLLVFNLAGNVAEWVDDFSGNYALTTDALVTDPTGPASGQTTNKIFRGGSFAGVSGTLEGKDRFSSSPATQSAAIGFRCASPDLVKY